MLWFYLATVIIWMIIIFCVTVIFKSGLEDKITKYSEELGVDEKKARATKAKGFGALFVMSAVPIIRLIIAIMIPYAASCSDEQFEKIFL